MSGQGIQERDRGLRDKGLVVGKATQFRNELKVDRTILQSRLLAVEKNIQAKLDGLRQG